MNPGLPVVLAVDLPAAVRARIGALRPRSDLEAVRWVPPTELRLWLAATLAPHPEALAAVARAVARTAARCDPFRVTLGPLTPVPHGEVTRLQLAVADPPGALEKLGAALREELAAFGFAATTEPPVVPVGQRPGSEERALADSGPWPEVPVNALEWRAVLPARQTRSGSVPLGIVAVADAEETAARERAALDQELRQRLERRPRPPARPVVAPKRRPPIETNENQAEEPDEDDSDDTPE